MDSLTTITGPSINITDKTFNPTADTNGYEIGAKYTLTLNVDKKVAGTYKLMNSAVELAEVVVSASEAVQTATTLQFVLTMVPSATLSVNYSA